jgi:cathepsin L
LAFLVALIFAAASAAVPSERDARAAFWKWQTDFGKTYKSFAEHSSRFHTFRRNFEFISAHDPVAKGFTVALNEFADLTNEEFRAWGCGLNVTAVPHKSLVIEQVKAGVPSTWDWRSKGAVTPIKNQKQCGSCWSFSATGSTEGAHFLKNGNLPNLSEQNLIDCSTAYGNQGCNGGLMDQAFQYIIANKGIDTEASYPYTATGPNHCRYNSAHSASTLASYHDVPSGSETSLLNSVYARPVSVAIDASHQSFQFYSSGVYYEPACSATRLDHGVLAVGFGSENSADYWLVKNSWGTGWGAQGYIKMSRNRNNNCGIATAASYPVA